MVKKKKGNKNKPYRSKGRTKPVMRKKPVRPDAVPVADAPIKGPYGEKNRMVGLLLETDGRAYVEPDPGYDMSRYGRVQIRRDNLNGAPFQMKVVCEIMNPTDPPQSYQGRIVEVLGDPGSTDVEIEAIIKQYGVSSHFPNDVMKEATAVKKDVSEDTVGHELTSGRKDLRTLKTITIDGADAKDLDDAISIEELPNKGYRLYVHIADVAHYVRDASSLDREAALRGTSVYLVDQVLPMLPPQLSNGICSLNPGTIRLTLTADMHVNYQGEIVDGSFYESMIISDRRCTYREVNDALFDHTIPDDLLPFMPMLQTMKKLTDILSEKIKRRGALDFSFPETEVILDENRHPTDVRKSDVLYAHGMIESFMIACNEFIAEYFSRLQSPFVYRVHEDPDPDKIESFYKMARIFGVRAKKSERPTSAQLAEVEAAFRDKPYSAVLGQLLLRSLAKARYYPKNLGHFGLASKAYCHFTSPIRRYPDLYIHRIIKAYLCDRQSLKAFAPKVGKVSDHSSDMERNAMEAERASVDYKVCEYMQAYVGESYDAVITGIINSGLFVQLENTAEGMISFASMEDYFEYDPERLEAKGRRSGRVYRLGQSCRVRLTHADLRLRRLDFVFEQ